jgi:hypothetical protein
MGYIGNPPVGTFSSVSYQDLTGGSGTGFTLDYPVGSANEVEVFVNNVRQEPGVAYTVSGTTLTMTGTIATTDDFYVVFQSKAQQTATHPAGNNLQATDGTFTGDLTVDTDTLYVDSTNNRVGIGTASPSRILDISTTASTSPRVTGTSSNGAYLDFHNNAATTGRFRIGQGYASSTDNIGFFNNEANADMVFGTNNKQQVRIDSSGNKIFYGVGSSYNVEITDYGQLVGGIGAQTTAGTTNWNDSTNARSGSGFTLLLGSDTNGPGGGSYYHAFNFEYGTKDGTGNIAQWAIGYNTNARYMRYYYGGSWSSWVSF